MVDLGAAVRRTLDRFLVRVVAGVVTAGIAVMVLLVVALDVATSGSGWSSTQAGQVRGVVILVGVVGVLVLGATSFLVAYRETKHIRALGRIARRVAAGDVAARVSPGGAAEVMEAGAGLQSHGRAAGRHGRAGQAGEWRAGRLRRPSLRGVHPAGVDHRRADLRGRRDVGQHGGSWPGHRPTSPRRSSGSPPRPRKPATISTAPTSASSPPASAPWPSPTGSVTSAGSSVSSTTSPIRPTFWPSTLLSKRPALVRPAAALRWWRTR